MSIREKAIQITMQYYDVDRETALEIYMEEILAAERLIQRFEEECG